jgi:hypothetical protein
MHAVQMWTAFGAAGAATLPKKRHIATALSTGTIGLRTIGEYNAAVPQTEPRATDRVAPARRCRFIS